MTATITLQRVANIELALCSACKEVWRTKRPGGPEKCPKCQAIFTETKKGKVA